MVPPNPVIGGAGAYGWSPSTALCFGGAHDAGGAGLLVPAVTSTVTSPPSQFANRSWPAASKGALDIRNSTAVRFAVGSDVEAVVAPMTTATEPKSAPPTPQLL